MGPTLTPPAIWPEGLVTMAQVRSYFLRIGKSAGWSSSMDERPTSLATLASSSVVMRGKHHLHTECWYEERPGPVLAAGAGAAASAAPTRGRVAMAAAPAMVRRASR